MAIGKRPVPMIARLRQRLEELLRQRPREPLDHYRQWMRSRALGWAGLGSDPADGALLAQRFVETDTTTEVSARAVEELLSTGRTGGRGLRPQNPTDLRPLTVLEAWMLQRRMLLMGAAGSGKSFTLARLALALLDDRWQGLGRRPEAMPLGSLPVLLDLGGYAAWLARSSGPGSGLLAFLRQELAAQQLTDVDTALQAALQKGEAVVLADGIDEVAEAYRDPVAMALLALEQRFPGVAILVSCRSDEPCALPAERFPRYLLAPLTPVQQRALLRWPPDEALGDTWPPEPLLALLEKPWLALLAGNPLLLATMARVYCHDRGLPVEQAMLLERLVDIWLWRGRRAEVGGAQAPILELLAGAGLGMADLRRQLRRLAFEMVTAQLESPAEGQATLAALSEPPQVVARLTALHPDADVRWAEQLLAALRRPGGLWQHRQSRIGWVHPLVQEYLAGNYLALDAQLVATVSRLVRRDTGWWPVIRWALAYRTHVLGEQQLAVALAARLCPLEYPEEPADWQQVALAGEILRIVGTPRLLQAGALARDVLERVRERLVLLVEEGRCSVIARAVAGDCLGELRDERFADTPEALPAYFRQTLDTGQGFVRIGAGYCHLGWPAGAGSGSEYGNDEPLEIPYDYWIGRYPVTVAQYAGFMAMGGYREPRWWSAGGRTWLAQGFETPAHWEQQRRFPNRPVTGVCWFEADAYCRWLDARLGDGEQGTGAYGLRLATEAEWEKAARHGDTRRFPWGDEDWSPGRANLAESELGHPSAVGLFPGGGSPLGVQDLIGNVWEWTRSGFQSYPYDPYCNQARDQVPRTVRGGSWDSRAGTAQATTRSALFPEARLNDVGLRVVVGPRQQYF